MPETEDTDAATASAIGIILCYLALVEEKSRKVSLINSLQRLEISMFPSTPTPFAAYPVLTDGLGEVTLRLSVLRIDRLEAGYSREFTTIVDNPLRQLRS